MQKVSWDQTARGKLHYFETVADKAGNDGKVTVTVNDLSTSYKDTITKSVPVKQVGLRPPSATSLVLQSP